MTFSRKLFFPAALACALFLGAVSPALAADGAFEITVKDHQFSPAELTVPAGQKVKVIVKNLDVTPIEFESHELNREKVIKGGGQGTFSIGPLKPGSYPYFDEFNPQAKGVIKAE